MPLSLEHYNALEPRDYVTDAKGNSVQLIEKTATGWTGRKLGFLNDRAFGHWTQNDLLHLVEKVSRPRDVEAVDA